MITASCLCGGVRFEIAKMVGPFELCHCRRCRKASGSAFAAMIGVEAADLRLVAGGELVVTYAAPLVESPPPYRTAFCRRCGSALPVVDHTAPRLEVPAGLLDDDPGRRPDRHIYVDCKAAWDQITDSAPQLDRAGVRALRASGRGPVRP
jgi:hypothetical protein